MSKGHAGPPGWLDKTRFIWFYLLNGCETPLYVYVKAGGLSIGNAVLTLLGFDMLDLVRALFRPKGLRGTAHGSRAKKNKGKGKATNAIPEIPEIIGDEARAETGLQKPKYSAAGEAIWAVDNVTQRGLYYVMIANVIADFAFDWYSGIIKDPGSDCELGRGQIVSDLEIVGAGGWNIFVLNTTTFMKPPVYVHSSDFAWGPGKYFVSLACRAGKAGNFPPYLDTDVQIGLKEDFFAEEFVSVSERITLTSTEPRDLICTATFEGNAGCIFMVYNSTDFAHFYDIEATCFQIAE